MSVLNVALRTALRTSANAVASTSSAGVHTSANLDMPQSARRNPNRTTKDGKIPVTMIPGDGVGPEIMEATMDLIKHIGAPVTFEVMQLSEINRIFSAPVEKVIESVARNKIALKGVIAVPETGRDGELESVNQTFRKSLDLYANVVKCRSLDGVGTRHEGIDMVIIREQTEGEYSALEHESTPGVVECLKVVTAEKSLRIAKFAFDYATRFGRKKVTCVHKANIMKQGDGLFMKCCEDIAKMYPNIEFEKMIVDNTTMQLVSKPQQFDVMVMPNLYGNIIDNLGAGLVGGAGVVAGASYSADVAVFETGAHHTFTEGVGKNVANPTAMFLAAAKMLEHVGCDEYSKTIKGGVEKVLTEGKVKTRDLKGFSTTNDFTSAVINAI